MKGDKMGRFQGAPKADPYWPQSDMSQAWIKGNTAEKGGIICWIFQIIGVSFHIKVEQRQLIIMKSYECEWNVKKCRQRRLRVRGTGEGAPRWNVPAEVRFHKRQNPSFDAVTAVKMCLGKRANWFCLIWNLPVGWNAQFVLRLRN